MRRPTFQNWTFVDRSAGRAEMMNKSQGGSRKRKAVRPGSSVCISHGCTCTSRGVRDLPSQQAFLWRGRCLPRRRRRAAGRYHRGRQVAPATAGRPGRVSTTTVRAWGLGEGGSSEQEPERLVCMYLLLGSHRLSC